MHCHSHESEPKALSKKGQGVPLIHSAQLDHACEQTALGVPLELDRRHQSLSDLRADGMVHSMYDSLYKDLLKTYYMAGTVLTAENT